MMQETKADILLVEDTLTQAMVLKRLLEFHGHKVSIARSAEQAQKQLLQQSFQMILSDVNMPVTDGYELCRLIKADTLFRHIPFVLLVSFVSLGDIAKIMECGADNLIFKATDDDAFISRIQSVLQTLDLRSNAQNTGNILVSMNGEKLEFRPDPQRAIDIMLSCFAAVVDQNASSAKPYLTKE